MRIYLFVALAFCNSLFANTEIHQLLDNIRVQTDQTSDGLLLMRVQKQLEKVEALFSELHSLKCLSRDADGRSPFIASGLNAQGDLVKFSEMKFREQENCEASLSQSFSLNKNVFFCVSRDGDDRGPIQIAAVIGLQELSTRSEKLSVKFKSFDSCQDALKNASENDQAFNVCASRDGDESAPYKKIKISSNGLIEIKPESFATLKECRDIL